MNGAGLFFLLLLLLVILPAAAWVGYTRWRAHKQGLPPPPLSAYNPFKRRPASNYPISPRASNPITWIQDKFSSFRSSRGGGGGGGGGGDAHQRRGFGPLDPDGAWDDRVGTEADAYGPIGAGMDYEEQELGVHPPPPQHYGGSGYGQGGGGGGGTVLPAYGEERGRSRTPQEKDTAYVGGSQRGLDQRYDEEMHGSGGAGRDGASSRHDPFGDDAERSSMRPVSPAPTDTHRSLKADRDDASERRSIFREEV